MSFTPRRPDDWRRERNATVERGAEIAKKAAIDYDDEDNVNEVRADLGEAAVLVGCIDSAADDDWDAHVSDALANVIHFCHRAGVDAADLFNNAVRSAEGDLEDGCEAKRDAGRFP